MTDAVRQTTETDGRCQHWYDRGNRYRAAQAVPCRKRAVEVVDGMALCAAHAPAHRRAKADRDEALAQFLEAVHAE